FPYLFLGILLLRPDVPVGVSVAEWFYAVWLYQILLACVIGTIAGYLARRALQLAKARDWIDKDSFFATEIALALFLMGGVALIGSDDLLAVFVAGNVFTWDDWFRIETENAPLQEVIDMMLSLSFFVYFGAIIPWRAIVEAGVGRIVGCCAMVLVLRRLPAL